MKLIVAALPDDVVPRRLELLLQILREWAGVDLHEHFSFEAAAARRRRVRLAKVEKTAALLLQAMKDLDETDQWDLAAQH